MKPITILLLVLLILVPTLVIAQNGEGDNDTPDEEPGEDYKERMQEEPKERMNEETRRNNSQRSWFAGESLFTSLSLLAILGVGVYLVTQR